MCLGRPGEVIEIHPEQPDLAKVDVSGVRREAAAAMEFLEGIGQAYDDEIAALKESLIE